MADLDPDQDLTRRTDTESGGDAVIVMIATGSAAVQNTKKIKKIKTGMRRRKRRKAKSIDDDLHLSRTRD